MTAVTAAPDAGSRFGRVLQKAVSPQGAVFLLLIALLVTIAILNPNFTEPGQFMRFLQRVSPIVIAAIGQYFVIVSGEFDLSMGSLVTAQGIIAAVLIGQDDTKIVPVLALMIVFGLVVGLINGLLTTLLKVPSFIVTLGMMLALLGAVRFLTGGGSVGNPTDTVRVIGRGGLRDVPVLDFLPWAVVVLAAVLAIAIWLSRRPFGKLVVAVGDSAVAGRYAGARIWWIKTRAFMISSTCATIAAVLLVGYAGTSRTLGEGYEFTAITAVVLGGVVLGGGKGWVVAAAAGALALEALFTVLNFVDLPSTLRVSVQGIVIIVAVAYSALVFGARRKRLREEASPAPALPESGEGSDGEPVPADSAPESRPFPGEQR